MLAPTASLGELYGSTFRTRLDQDPRSLLEAAEQDIMHLEKAAASREPPWDGFCGLLKVRLQAASYTFESWSVTGMDNAAERRHI